MITSEKALTNLNTKLDEIKKELNELEDLQNEFKDQDEWRKIRSKFFLKKYLLEEILEID
jgi:hypothetical protein